MRRRRAEGPGTHRTLTRLALLLAAGGLIAGAACADARSDPRSAGAPADTAAIVDAAGRTLRFAQPPGRILSLVPSVTRALVELGAGAMLVGRTDYDTLAAVRGLPSVGGGLQPDLERLLALRPDLVIRFAGAQDPTTPAALDERAIAHMAVRPDRVEDVRTIVRQLGIVTGRRAAADSLVAALDASLAAVRERVAGEARPRVAYLIGGTPPWVAGPRTYVSDLLEVAGADNAFADLGDLYAPVSLEELIAREVDAFVVARGTELSPRLAARAPVLQVSPEIESPDTGLGRSAEELARVLHPGAFR